MITDTTFAVDDAAPPPARRAHRFLLRRGGADRSVAPARAPWPARGSRRPRTGTATTRCSREAVDLFGDVAPLEAFFAYPGPRLMAAIEQALAERNAGVCVRLVQHVSARAADRRLPVRHRRPGIRCRRRAGASAAELLPPDMQGGNGHKPYFEILIVTPADPAQWERARHELKRLRRADDPFVYEVVQVGRFEDAVLGTDLQPQPAGGGDPRRLRVPLAPRRAGAARVPAASPATAAEASTAPGALATALARAVKRYRPELDVYLLTDRDVEELAGSDEAAPIRRIFYDVEELMELHLAILDGVNDRYETPYFDNLKKYAQRPIGTFHALPIARGKSIFKSNWIRDMGEFYGTNLFLAESSATTGGLDSLLEPTGNIKMAQDKAARAFGAERALLRHQRHLDVEQDRRTRRCCKPGDIVLIDRNCHKSHHYGLVLAGAQPLLHRGLPADAVLDVRRACRCKPIKKALLDSRPRASSTASKLVDLTNCTFDGHMYNPTRVMQECLAIKPDLIFLWDEAWFGFARFIAVPPPAHGDGRGRGADRALARSGVPRSATRRSRPRRRARPGRPEAARHAAAAGSGQGAHPRLPDRLDAQVDVGAAAGLDDPGRGRGLPPRRGAFKEAFFTHTSTSPNLQIIASLDVARRQMELEGYELMMRATELAIEHPARDQRAPADLEVLPRRHARRDGPGRVPRVGHRGLRPRRTRRWHDAARRAGTATSSPSIRRASRSLCGSAGFDGTQFKGLLAERVRHPDQQDLAQQRAACRSTSTTRAATWRILIKALADMSREIDQRLAEGGEAERAGVRRRACKSLMTDVPDLPNFSRFHDAFRDDPEGTTQRRPHARGVLHGLRRGELRVREARQPGDRRAAEERARSWSRPTSSSPTRRASRSWCRAR